MIILTGGAGFIGSCFLAHLNQNGREDIIVVDHLTDAAKRKNLEGKHFKKYLEKDEFLLLVKANKAPKASHIVHMGACSSTILTDADYYEKNNYEYTRVLAEWALRERVPFLYASSAATYGDGRNGFSDDNEATLMLKPLNLYGSSKHKFDLWVLNKGLDVKVTGLKFFNVFGPNEYHKGEMRSVICKKFEEIKTTGKITLFKSYRDDYADGEQKRDFIYIKDALTLMYYLFEHPQVTGIYNVGTGKARSWNDLAKAMFAAFGKKPNIEYIDMPEYLRPKYQYFTQASMEKLAATGCPVACQSLEASVADYVPYLQKHLYL